MALKTPIQFNNTSVRYGGYIHVSNLTDLLESSSSVILKLLSEYSTFPLTQFMFVARCIACRGIKEVQHSCMIWSYQKDPKIPTVVSKIKRMESKRHVYISNMKSTPFLALRFQSGESFWGESSI